MTKAKLLLFLLALGVVASFYYAWQTMPRVQHAGEGTPSSTQRRAQSQSAAAQNSRFDFSGGEQSRFRRPKRNLFGPLFPPPPPPKVKVVAKPVQPVAPVTVAPPPPPPVEKPVPVRVATLPMPAFKVLGFLAKKQQVTAFISLRNKVHLVKQGETFADEFKVVALNAKTITLGRISGSGEVSLPLDEKSGTAVFSGPKSSVRPNPAPVRIFRPGNRGVNPLTRPESRPSMPVVHPPIKGAN